MSNAQRLEEDLRGLVARIDQPVEFAAVARHARARQRRHLAAGTTVAGVVAVSALLLAPTVAEWPATPRGGGTASAPTAGPDRNEPAGSSVGVLGVRVEPVPAGFEADERGPGVLQEEDGRQRGDLVLRDAQTIVQVTVLRDPSLLTVADIDGQGYPSSSPITVRGRKGFETRRDTRAGSSGAVTWWWVEDPGLAIGIRVDGGGEPELRAVAAAIQS